MMPDTENSDPPSTARVSAAARRGVVVDIGASVLVSDAERKDIGERLRASMGYLGCGGEVRVRFVDDSEMIRLHREHCNDPTTTDVLTFDLAEGGSALDVDLILCVDEAARQANRRQHQVTDELTLYALHGVLHCLGYDDHTEDAFRTMHAREDEVLRAIGMGAIYSAPDVEGGAT